MQHFANMQQNSKCKNQDEIHAAFLPICIKIENVKTNMNLMQHFCHYAAKFKMLKQR